MRLMPKDNVGKIEFCKVRLPTWAENAEEIGTSPEMVAALAAQTEAANAAYKAQQMAQNAARSATIDLNVAITRMSKTATAIISQARGKALIAGDSVYPLASLPVPAKGSPIGAPGKPENFRVTLDAIGGITLRWECKNPKGSQGTIYRLWRSIDNGPREYIGVSGKRKFHDAKVPAGIKRIVYTVQAVRSTAVGEEANYNVYLGTSGQMPRSFVPKSSSMQAAA